MIEGRPIFNISSHDARVFLQAESCYANMSAFREEFARCMRYNYGDQLSDVVPDDHGRPTKEGDLMAMKGYANIVENMIRKTTNCVQGLFLGQNSEPTCKAKDREEAVDAECLTILYQYTNEINEQELMDCTLVEEGTIGGAWLAKERYGRSPKNGKVDCWQLYVNPRRFFINSDMEDPRGFDCTMIGEVHDLTWGQILSMARSKNEKEHLREVYSYAASEMNLLDNSKRFGKRRHINTSFLMPDDTQKCRLIEVWNKEHRERYMFHDQLTGEIFTCAGRERQELVESVNRERREERRMMGVAPEEIEGKLIVPVEMPNGSADGWFEEEIWYYRYFAPTGEVLWQGVTPYEHGEHPYIFVFHPFVNGEIHSLVSDLIDVQRYINRLINLNDYIMRSSAKGLLMVPETALEGTGMSIEDIADIWAKPAGVFIFKPRQGVELPKQITSQTNQAEMAQLIQIQKSFFDDISNVNAALQGKSVGSVSGSYYAQQTQNAATSLQGMLTRINAFKRKSAEKRCKNIQQYYDDEKIIQIVGRDGAERKVNPKKVRDLEYDITITESQSTPVFREIANEFLMQCCQAGWISFENMLKSGQFPYGDKVLTNMQAEQQKMVAEQAGLDQPTEPAGTQPSGGRQEVVYDRREPQDVFAANDERLRAMSPIAANEIIRAGKIARGR